MGIVQDIEAIRRQYPDNLMARHFNADDFNRLHSRLQTRLSRIIHSGIVNPDSVMGVYAMQPDDYDVFRTYLDKLIRDYHGIHGEIRQISNWHIDEKLDLLQIDPSLNEVSMRVRTGRNIANLPLPGAMCKQERLDFENRMIEIFRDWMKREDFGGSYMSLTPGSAFRVSERQYRQLVKEHKMFRDMSSDPYLRAAGISADWPYGRGMYISEDHQFIVWVGEEDLLRIMVMKRGHCINSIFRRLQDSLNELENSGLRFALSDRYGALTSCPTNLGTGMRASLHLPLPRLTNQGTDMDRLKPVARSLGLSVRGIGGEHTAAGAGGVVDISPTARLHVTEAEIAHRLYKGAAKLWEVEHASSGL